MRANPCPLQGLCPRVTNRMYRPYRAECSSVVVTQGGASLCPGLACFGPYGANKQMVGNAHPTAPASRACRWHPMFRLCSVASFGAEKHNGGQCPPYYTGKQSLPVAPFGAEKQMVGNAHPTAPASRACRWHPRPVRSALRKCLPGGVPLPPWIVVRGGFRRRRFGPG